MNLARHPRSFPSGLGMSSLAVLLLACQVAAPPEEATVELTNPHVVADDAIEAGRYFVITAGCNDCHTDGYLESETLPT